MRRPKVEGGAGKKLGISAVIGVIIILGFTSILFATLYGDAKKDSLVLQNLRNYLLEGSNDNLRVSDLLYQYDGQNFSLSGGKLAYLGKAEAVKSYGYKVILKDIAGKEQPVTLVSGSVTNSNSVSGLPVQIIMDHKSGAAGNLDYANLASKYIVKVEFTMTTEAGILNRELFLKITELNSDFFRQ